MYRYDDDSCYLFDEDTPGEQISIASLFGLPEEKQKTLWVLTDWALQKPCWCNQSLDWFVVLAASPAKVESSRDWEKGRRIGTHFMTTWEWSEIFAAYWYQLFINCEKPI